MIAFVASLFDFLRRQRHGWETALNKVGLAHTISPARYKLHREISRAIGEYSKGECLDAGCGHAPYKELLQQHGNSVTSVDIENRAGKTDVIADLQNMPQVTSDSFDTILCTQVLEHLPCPWQAMRELARVLRAGGSLIVTVPHLSMIHEAPHDYYRYTCYGLKSLCAENGLDVIELRPASGLVVFLGHSASLALVCTLGAIPGVRWIAWFVNYVFFVRLVDLIDKVVGLPRLYPCDYLLVARKPAAEATP